MEQLAQLPGVPDRLRRQHNGDPADQLIRVADIVGLQRRANVVQQGNALERQEVAQLFPAEELADLGRGLECVAKRNHQAFAVRRHVVQVGRQAGLRQAVADGGEDRLAVEPLQRL